MIIDDIKNANVQAMKSKDHNLRSIYSVVINKYMQAQIEARLLKKEVNDETEITNLRKRDSICFKITTALIIGIGFLSAILRFKISSKIIGYMLMGVYFNFNC